ncbi:MAG: cysteinyl-tRNA synthetase [Verrucomicrobiales bacterium]
MHSAADGSCFLIMAKFVLNDTLTRSKREVYAEDGETLRFYCCGPTVYGPAHIGNFRTFIVQDTFRRVAELSGLKTKHVRNITDVDDKTIRESVREGKSLKDFTGYWRGLFDRDCAALNLLTPHIEPSAVEHIPEQVALIEKLVTSGHAYQGNDGSVYFKVSAFEGYGKLSHLENRELKLGASANDSDEYEKESLADFALWKARKPEDGDNFWESPWGQGRPGWHLECSAMGMKYLSESFDLHAGGVDLCFPHHDNEIAQSEAATGKTFSRHWFHSEHLMVEGQKMSKSLKNLYTLDDINHGRRDGIDGAAPGYSAAELRFEMLSGYYRQKMNFTWDGLRAARINLERIAAFVHLLEALSGRAMSDYAATLATSATDAGAFSDAWAALLDDLNTPSALGLLNSAMKPLEKRASSGDVSAEEAGELLDGLSLLVHAFGWELPAARKKAAAAEVPANVQDLADKRVAARSAKDWSASDALRDEIAALGWQVKDGKDGYELTKLD